MFQVLTMGAYCSMHIVRRVLILELHIVRRVLILKLDGSLWLNIILSHLMTREAAIQVPGWAPG